MKKISYIVLIVFAHISCESPNTHTLSTNFHERNNIISQGAFSLKSEDGVNSIMNLNNMICVENSNISPVFDFYEKTGEYVGGIGIIGHGKNEFIMPHIFSGINDTIMVVDNSQKKIFSFYDNMACNKKNFYVNCCVNEVRTIHWPYIGYYHLTKDGIIWNIYNVSNKEIVETLTFNGGEAYLETFSWSSFENYIVFAYQYHNKIRICKISSNMKIVDDKILQDDTLIPHESRCYYTDIVCGKDYFILLSQKSVDGSTLSGVSKIQLYNYDGKPLKEFILDGIQYCFSYIKTPTNLFIL